MTNATFRSFYTLPRVLALARVPHRLPVHVHPRRQILHGDPQRFEQRDLILRPPAGDLALEHLAHLAEDVTACGRPLLAGEEESASLGEQRRRATAVAARARGR